MVQPDLLLHTVVTPDKSVIAAFVGDRWEAKMEGCRFYAGRFSVTIREKADMIIFFCGGLYKILITN
jgi:lactate racemase